MQCRRNFSGFPQRIIASSDPINEYFPLLIFTDDVRSKAWPLLLGLKDRKAWQNISQEQLESHPEYNQVVLDVNRSIKRFPPSIEDAKRESIQEELIATIVTILSRNPGLHYYQASFCLQFVITNLFPQLSS